MHSGTYRLRAPTICLISENGRDVANFIPESAIVTIRSGTNFNGKLVEVIWQGKTVMMFGQDLRDRGTPMKLSIAAKGK